MQEAIEFASRTKTIQPCEFGAFIGSSSRTKTVQPLHWYKSTLGSLEHFVHIEGVVGSSPTVTTEKSGRRSRSTLAGAVVNKYWTRN